MAHLLACHRGLWHEDVRRHSQPRLRVTVNRTYFVLRTNPSGYTSTNAIPETVTTDNSTATKINNDQIKVVLANNASARSLDNKFLATQNNASISGTVYNDVNGNGAFD